MIVWDPNNGAPVFLNFKGAAGGTWGRWEDAASMCYAAARAHAQERKARLAYVSQETCETGYLVKDLETGKPIPRAVSRWDDLRSRRPR